MVTTAAVKRNENQRIATPSSGSVKGESNLIIVAAGDIQRDAVDTVGDGAARRRWHHHMGVATSDIGKWNWGAGELTHGAQHSTLHDGQPRVVMCRVRKEA